ncbi:hypothetical protein ACEPPN_016459 [Leptodophora sp. 'Broadleaf-Isolate-01']
MLSLSSCVRRTLENLHPKAAANVYIEYTKTEEQALTELEIWNRRTCVAGLNRRNFTLPASKVFHGLSSANAIFKNCIKKTTNDYKNWKTQILKTLLPFSRTGFHDHRKDVAIATSIDYKYLVKCVNEDTVIDWVKVSQAGFDFIRYVLVHMMVQQHLTLRFKETQNDDLSKYTRSHLSTVYDSFHSKKRFKSITIDDFPFRDVPTSNKRIQLPSINLDEDTDFDEEEDFFGSEEDDEVEDEE